MVAIFPQGLERLRLADLGGAGHLGFMERHAHRFVKLGSDQTQGGRDEDASVANIRFIPGGHSAALTESNLDDITEFVLHGTTPRPAHVIADQNPGIVWLGRLAPFVWFLLASLVIGIGAGLLAPLGTPGWILAVLFALYLSVLRVILTRA